MSHLSRLVPLFALALVAFAGCKQEQGKPDKQPAGFGDAKAKPVEVKSTPLSAARMIQPAIQFQEATLTRGPNAMKVWYYFPAVSSGKLPLVIVPPAGSTGPYK